MPKIKPAIAVVVATTVKFILGPFAEWAGVRDQRRAGAAAAKQEDADRRVRCTLRLAVCVRSLRSSTDKALTRRLEPAGRFETAH